MNNSNFKTGKQRQYELGRFIRERYATFLNTTYSENDVYVQSSDLERTIMSAEAFLTGIYKSEIHADFWNTHLPWQPYPVHTLPLVSDNMILSTAKCDAFDKDIADYMATDEIQEFNRTRKDLYNYLSLHTGEDIRSIYDVVPIRDVLFIERNQNRR